MKKKYFLAIILIISISIISISKNQVYEINSNKIEKNNNDIIFDGKYITDNTKVSLTITNKQNTSEVVEYSYTLQVNETSGAHPYKIGNTDGYLVFDAKGLAKFTLKSNESITIENLPFDVAYNIEQSSNSNFVTYINNVEKNSYSAKTDINNSIIIRNETTSSNPVPTPVIPDEEEKETSPSKEEEEDNPYTIDKIAVFMLFFIVTVVLLIGLKKYKVKKFGA